MVDSHAKQRHGASRLGCRRIFRGQLAAGVLTLHRGGWVQRITDEGGDAGQRDGSMRLVRAPGQLAMVSNADVERWSDVALVEVVTAYPEPDRVGVRIVAGTCPDGTVFVEPVTKRIAR